MDINPVTLLSDLVRIDSTSGGTGEGEVLRAVARVFESSSGSRVQWATDSAGVLKGLLVLPAVDTGQKLLVFACHGDVVPVSDPGEWTSGPFTPTTRHGRLYGRGSSDMKSGLAVAVAAVANLHAIGAPVALAVSTGEEIGCLGAPAIADALDPGRIGAMIIPESTNNRVALGHRGALWLTVTARGVAAHGSTPDHGVNAILKMSRVLERLNGLPLRSHPELGSETVNVGVIRAGTVPNIVPDTCQIRVDHRIVDADVEPFLDWWRSQSEISDVAVDLSLAPVWTNATDPWVQSLPAPQLGAPVSYYTDASIFTARDGFQAPVVVWGPGDPDVVHSLDESVQIAAIDEAEGVYRQAGYAWTARKSG